MRGRVQNSVWDTCLTGTLAASIPVCKASQPVVEASTLGRTCSGPEVPTIPDPTLFACHGARQEGEAVYARLVFHRTGPSSMT